MSFKRVKNKTKRRKSYRAKGGNLNPADFIPFNPDVSAIPFPESTSNMMRGGRHKRKNYTRNKNKKQRGGYFGADLFSRFNYNLELTNALYNGTPVSSVPSPYPFSTFRG